MNLPASNTRWRRGGFTLPEVLAALVLIGIVLPVTMRGLSMALAAASHARFTTRAAVLAETKLNEMIAYGDWGGAASGDFGSDAPGFRWTYESRTRDYVIELAVQVFWIEQDQERSLRIATLVHEGSSGATSILP
jgi:prepilin-type N-terminal cleavage/methylation domain-containing protein